jgi:glycosyltransferase involved in cell wall biosynthesis
MLNGLVVESWISKFLENENLESTIFYSFWNDISTMGMAMSSSSINAKVITRCHNFDLYGNKENNFYVPFFNYVFENMHMVFPDSASGASYLNSRSKKIKLGNGIMGTLDPLNINLGSSDGVLRIASCAVMIPRKRIKLFVLGLALYANKFKEKQIEWFHVGDGPMFSEITNLVEREIPNNCKVHFKRKLTHQELMEFYKVTPLDLFVNTSSKEGTPVSLMEAISFGIPILVTAFGGNEEMASLGAGTKLPVNSTPEIIYEALEDFENENNIFLKRKNARKVWEGYYNCDLVYKVFCEIIKEI